MFISISVTVTVLAFGLTGSVFDQTTKKVMWSCDIQPFPWHVSRTDKCRFCLVIHRLMALLNHIQNTITTITTITSGNTQRNPTVRVRLLAMQRRRSFILNIFSLTFSGNTQKNYWTEIMLQCNTFVTQVYLHCIEVKLKVICFPSFVSSRLVWRKER